MSKELPVNSYSDQPSWSELDMDKVRASDTPVPLIERINYQREEVAFSSILGSGHIALLGDAMRRALPKNRPLAIQRPWGDRPTIEEYASFFPTDSPIPVSTISVRQLMAGQVLERWHEHKKLYKQKRFVRALEELYDIGSGLGVSQGVSMTIRALGTLNAAVSSATWSGVKRKTGADKDLLLYAS